MLLKLPKIFINKLINLIFPNQCLSCLEIINNNANFCLTCWQQLKFISSPCCEICSQPFEEYFNSRYRKMICLKCLLKKPAFDQVFTIFHYNEIIKKIVLNLKYNDNTLIASKIADLLAKKFASKIAEFDLIVAVPIHRSRLYKRKFNQAVLISKIIHRKPLNVNESNVQLQPKFYPDILIRLKDTKTQTKLNSRERAKNLKRAFLVKKKYRNFIINKKILLIDDVITTGATAQECSKTLKRFKAREVAVMTLAKTVLNY
ncbi:MAG: ComF family protein [Rickettsiales bacterium]|jgi:ComF family protein|nr:ComF family protein [Rickettsiales bacterium]